MKTMYFIHYFELKLETITSVLSRHVNFFIEGKYMGFFPLSFLNSSRKTFQIKTENFVNFSYKVGAKNNLNFYTLQQFLFIYLHFSTLFVKFHIHTKYYYILLLSAAVVLLHILLFTSFIF